MNPDPTQPPTSAASNTIEMDEIKPNFKSGHAMSLQDPDNPPKQNKLPNKRERTAAKKVFFEKKRKNSGEGMIFVLGGRGWGAGQ